MHTITRYVFLIDLICREQPDRPPKHQWFGATVPPLRSNLGACAAHTTGCLLYSNIHRLGAGPVGNACRGDRSATYLRSNKGALPYRTIAANGLSPTLGAVYDGLRYANSAIPHE